MSIRLLRLLLVALTLAAYGGVWGFDFVAYDDLTFVLNTVAEMVRLRFRAKFKGL